MITEYENDVTARVECLRLAITSIHHQSDKDTVARARAFYRFATGGKPKAAKVDAGDVA